MVNQQKKGSVLRSEILMTPQSCSQNKKTERRRRVKCLFDLRLTREGIANCLCIMVYLGVFLAFIIHQFRFHNAKIRILLCRYLPKYESTIPKYSGRFSNIFTWIDLLVRLSTESKSNQIMWDVDTLNYSEYLTQFWKIHFNYRDKKEDTFHADSDWIIILHLW